MNIAKCQNAIPKSLEIIANRNILPALNVKRLWPTVNRDQQAILLPRAACLQAILADIIGLLGLFRKFRPAYLIHIDIRFLHGYP